jgi:hypothetical protein
MATNRIGIEIEVDSNGAIRSLRQLGRAGEQAGEDIADGANNASAGMNRLDVSAIAVTAAMVALGAIAIKITKDFVKFGLSTAREAEKVEVQFKTLLGSAELAKKRYAELAAFAASTPFQLAGVANASKILETLTKGTLSTGPGLRLVGDAAAIAGVQFDELAVTVGRAFSGLQSNRAIGESLSRLQELGLISGEARTKIEELQKVASGKEGWAVLQEELKKTTGGMDALSKTIAGKESTLVDNLGALAMQVLKTAGVLETYKSALDAVTSEINIATDIFKEQEIIRKNINDLTAEEAELIVKLNRERLKALKDVERFGGSAAKAIAAVNAKFRETLNIQSQTLGILSTDGLLTASVMSKIISKYGQYAEAVRNKTKLDDEARQEANELAQAELNLQLILAKGVDVLDRRNNLANAFRLQSKDVEEQAKVFSFLNTITEERIELTKKEQTEIQKRAEVRKQEAIDTIKDAETLAKALEFIDKSARVETSKAEQLQKDADTQKQFQQKLLLETQMIDANEFERKQLLLDAETQLKIEQAEKIITIESEKAAAIQLIEENAAKKSKAIDDLKNKLLLLNSASAISALSGGLRTLFDDNKAFAIADIGIKTAQGVIGAFANSLPLPLQIAQAAAIGAVGTKQLLEVNRAKFADGGIISGPGTNRSDSIPISVSNGEAILNQPAVQRLGAETVNNINNGGDIGSSINITINAGVGADADEIAQVTVNAIHRAEQLGLEPSV